jgi:hypothetical protein
VGLYGVGGCGPYVSVERGESGGVLKGSKKYVLVLAMIWVGGFGLGVCAVFNFVARMGRGICQ